MKRSRTLALVYDEEDPVLPETMSAEPPPRVLPKPLGRQLRVVEICEQLRVRYGIPVQVVVRDNRKTTLEPPPNAVRRMQGLPGT